MIIIAPDSFKGTLSASEVCSIIKEEFLKIDNSLDIRSIPVADGGEGTVEALLANGGELINLKVTGPLFEKVNSFYGIMPDGTAVIEMAAASGLPMVGKNRNPMLTTTFGTGELIVDALNRGCKKILIGVGGSATNDGGIGCAAVLGVKFLDKNGEIVPLNGSGLSEIADIDMSGLDLRIKDVQIEVLCDVVSPLYGKNGAAYVFAPQKGADEKCVKLLDDGLKNLSEVVKTKLGINNAELEGAGAAGGLAYGLVTFSGAKLVKGAKTILKALKLEELAENAELVITGEGCMDNQSLLGKVPAMVAELSVNARVIAIVGMSKVNDLSGSKIEKIYPTISSPMPFAEIKRNCRDNLAKTARQAAEDFMNE